MKKKILLCVFFCATLAALVPVAFASSSDSYEFPERTCSYCGAPAVIDYKRSYAPTCQKNGRCYYVKCACGASFPFRVLYPVGTGHKPGEILSITTEPQCKVQGYGTFICSFCNQEVTDDIPALGHDMVDVVPECIPCDATEYFVTSVCSRCSYRTSQSFPHDPKPHSPDAFQGYEPELTCTTGGYAIYDCSTCGANWIESTPALGHDFQETSRENATCTAPGSVNYSCSRCTETKTEVIPQLAEDHTWVETSRTDATCTAAGSASYNCSVCSETKTESFEALGHDFQEASRIPATCTVPGSIQYDCSRCAETKTEVIPQLAEDHTWVEASRIEPNCGPGSIEYICATCQEARTESIPPVLTEHSYEAVEVVPATYDDDGNLLTASKVVYSCSDCQASYTASVGISPGGVIVNEGEGGVGMYDTTAALGKSFLSGIWALFGIYVPGFGFTFGQMWLGVLLASLSILVIRMIFGFGGGPRGESSRTSSTSNPRISKERRHDEF